MAAHQGADGWKVNWINYKTGFKGLYFRMDVDNKQAFIGIVMNQKNQDLQALFYEQFEELKSVLHAQLGEEWIWESAIFDDHGHQISRIYTGLDGLSVFKKDDWPALISFLKPRLLALDEFWSLAKNHFAPLADL